ncbi:MAG TPA: CpsB/CapC family capsule biosynthesis tyrosine phosphatase [Gemmataceae bacterium]|jgi:protein-tyrosine phosphatase|nr:CpsB/CapC family capsule biosynthesis tyrosine phosphatase [Gemmataceae bacterium]
MIPLVDMHCHLLAGLDDGPRSDEEALAMCRIACEEGTRLVAATAHQNESWPEVTPGCIRQAATLLSQRLNDSGIELTVFPCAEVMVHPEIETAWLAGDHLSVGDRGQYLLIEMPHALFLDLSSLPESLKRAGVRPILAHPERNEELLHEAGVVDQLIHAGCLVQVSSGSVTDPPSGRDEKALKSWFKRGVVHFLGSDGHSPSRRPPRMAAAYNKIRRWAGDAVADRVCSTNGLAVLQGMALRIQMPEPKRTGWLPKIF